MEWNVYYHDFNSGQIKIYNALACEGDIYKLLKKSKTKEEFSDQLRHEMMWRYWSKCEWETIIGPWVSKNDFFNEAAKIDVFDQLNLNWDRLVDYCWSFKGTRSA